jgi:hypothetical protein
MSHQEDIELENHKYKLVAQLEQYKEQMKREREQHLAGSTHMYRGAIDLALISIRSLIIVNGGAVIALLTFSGNLLARGEAPAMASAIAASMTNFLEGLILSLFTCLTSYLTQVAFSELPRSPENNKARRWGSLIRWLAIAGGMGSLLAFSLGAYRASQAFVHIGEIQCEAPEHEKASTPFPLSILQAP